jgi:cytochrome c-type protein NapB
LLSAIVSLGVVVFVQPVAAQESLRGTTPLTETNEAPEVTKLITKERRFARAYRQQPPLIPHKVEDYQIDLKVNECMRCHDWPYNVQEDATKISETHYFDRNGVALDRVSGTRWFCTQCHVPQDEARELVSNEFKSALDSK